MKAVFASHHALAGDLTLGDHHFLREFGRDGWECLWIRGMVTPVSWLRRPGAAGAEWRRWWRGPAPVATPAGPVPEWVAAGWLPYREAAWHRALRWCGRGLYPRARRVLRRAGFGAPEVLWLGNMRLLWLTRLFPGATLVHRVGDRMSEFPESAPDVARLQAAVVRRADVVIATSAGIIADLADVRTDITLVPNAVECARFDGPLPPEPAALASLPRPRCCYVGAIDSWFDWAAVRACAAGVRGGSVVLVGPVRKAPPADLPANVHRVGPCAYADVPAWLGHCDVGCMPFLANPLTEAVSPLKVFEYLAAGLPVVSRDLRATRALALPITLVGDADAFGPAVAAACAAPGDAAARRRAAAAHDWAARYRVVRDLIGAARAGHA